MSSNTFKSKIKSALTSRTAKKFAVGAATFLLVGMANAQVGTGGTGGLCQIGFWLKTVIGATAILAGLIMVINSFFGKSEIIADIVTKILVGCAIVAMLGFLVAQTGLNNSCGL